MKRIKEYNFVVFSIAAIFAALLRWQIDDIYYVNCIGCFLLGLVNTLNLSKKYQLIYGFAFCGSLTTFSGWMLQLYELISTGFTLLFLVNVLKFVFSGTLAVCLGKLLGQKIKKLTLSR